MCVQSVCKALLQAELRNSRNNKHWQVAHNKIERLITANSVAEIEKVNHKLTELREVEKSPTDDYDKQSVNVLNK